MKCTANNETNVVKIYSSSKQPLEMKTRRPRKRKLTESGHFAGRWTKDEHLRFIKGNLNLQYMPSTMC